MFPELSGQETEVDSDRTIAVGVQAAALQDFLLKRADTEEDGHIGMVGLSYQGSNPDGGINYRFAMADEDGEERGETFHRWVDLGGIVSTENIITSSESGIEDTQVIRFGAALDDQIPLLAGFFFRREGGGDHHLREIAVLPGPGGYSVTFRDDSPQDDRYTASIDTILVPDKTVVSRHVQHFDDLIGSIDIAREPGQAALCGFSLRYRDSDHHVRQIQVGVSGDRIRLSMRDNDRNRRFEATVEYVILTD